MLVGKNAVVTGSTSGIGQAIAVRLAQEGCNVMLNGLGDRNEIGKLKRELAENYKVKVEYSPADMSKPAEIECMIADANQTFGAIDILVNDAGIQFTSPVDKFPNDRWDAIIAINLSAAFHSIKHTLPIMRMQKSGRIINVISVHGLVASIHKAAYIAAKHGLAGLTKVVALETAKENITCNGICPGWVLTPLVQKQIDERSKQKNQDEEAAKEEILKKQPTRQFVKAEDIAAYIVFLCGPHSASITGAMLTVDGGWTVE
jgi:3-hydroxybutyrate dehydrogenase